MPIKCPVAPLEFCFLADWYFHERGIRDRVELTYVTPLDGAFTKPVASGSLGGMLADKGIELVTEFNTGEVDGRRGKLTSYDGREVGFDLAVVVPLHGGAPTSARSPGLGDELNFVPTDEHTLQSKAAPNVFVIGDAANVPTSKAGSVTHFEGEVLGRERPALPGRRAIDASFDGHTNCFIESGFHKALLIDFNYETEPLPGHYPTSVGLPLLKESRLNHLGKLMFQWLYWHSLLPGRDLPGIELADADRGQDASAHERRQPVDEKGLTMPTTTYRRQRTSSVNDEGFFDGSRAVDRRHGARDRPRARASIRAHRAALAGHPLHASRVRSTKGTGPTVRVLGKTSGVSIKELYQLFPKGPAKTAAKIAGIPKPRGCI